MNFDKKEMVVVGCDGISRPPNTLPLTQGCICHCRCRAVVILGIVPGKSHVECCQEQEGYPERHQDSARTTIGGHTKCGNNQQKRESRGQVPSPEGPASLERSGIHQENIQCRNDGEEGDPSPV